MSSEDQKAAIARLVAGGKMTREDPGQYPLDDIDDESRNSLPDYDPSAVRKAMPDILQMDFDETSEGCFVVLNDGKTGETVTVPLGPNPPPDTEALIEAIQAHYAGQLDTEALKETAAAFDAFDEMED